MTTNFFDTVSHADFLRLVLEAFLRQGYELERSGSANADVVLRSRSGGRVALLCKKYRGAFIGRPVLQQFQEAKERLGCREGFLVTTTDCLPEAREFAKAKGISIYNRDGTQRLLQDAFGEGFLRTGRMPELGAKARAASAPARQPASMASYEKVSGPAPKESPEPAPPVAAPLRPPAVGVSEEVTQPEAPVAPEPPPTPEPPAAPVAKQEPLPARPTAAPEQPEEVAEVESIEASPPEPGAAPEEAPPNTTIVACAECNRELRVPTDQGMVKVTCTECGLRWLYMPENADWPEEPEGEPSAPERKQRISGDLRPVTVITCPTCSQKLNVPVNRGTLNVTCPTCKASWLFTP